MDDESCGCELVFVDGIQTTERDGLFGFKRADGTEIVPPRYKFVDEFHGDFCIVLTDYDQYGLINRRGQEVLPCAFREISYPHDGILKARADSLYGYYDTTGRRLLPPQWRAASDFFGGSAVVGVDENGDGVLSYGFIDTTGRLLLPAVYQYAYPFVEGRAVVMQYDRYGLIDSAGREVIPIKYLIMSTPNEGRVFARDGENGRIAMFDLSGQRLTDWRYDDVLYFSEGFYTVVRDTAEYYLDARGKERFGAYQRAGKFLGGYAMVMRGGKCGIINRRGKTVLPIRYDGAHLRPESYVFHEGLALVEQDGRYGYVDTRGRLAVPIQYESAFYFSDGLAPVRRDGLWGYVNRQGEEVIPFMFGPCSPFEYGRASVLYNNEEFKINPSGQCVKACADFPAGEVQRRMAQLSVQRHAK